jgi:hypothetical protein
MYNYCTLFDSNYLHKGLALYHSLLTTRDDFHLYVVAFDDDCYNRLLSLNLDKVTVISLFNFETPELLAVKPTRNRAEYCWTSGPSVIYHCIVNYKLDHCTYLDSDMMFYSSAQPIFNEIGKKSVAITEHFTEEIDVIGGRFCVQFVYFKNDSCGMNALNWWKDKCIEWCFARYEDGKYGDQKYLDYFPEKFDNICILKNRGAGVAQWNAFQYDFSNFGKIGLKKQLIDIIFYHYHGTSLDLFESTLTLKTFTFDLTPDLLTNVYIPYLELLKEVYTHYFGVKVNKIYIDKRTFRQRIYSKLKKTFRDFSFVQYVYFQVFKIKYNGYENKK